ncbi:hypothetical protein [Thermoflexibacter ruber]|uniref:Uncharacterized protein n=1 Tax=Thermoflexibacter ruber TaxID=1003 RepID=A0A1I2KBW8_9BACT|nr:hypothetical protein [Thermoflexibacter ruber]SFF62727.1 hypothetical protein SAMN04488541_10915 [Thermoflexibacter ruber]
MKYTYFAFFIILSYLFEAKIYAQIQIPPPTVTYKTSIKPMYIYDKIGDSILVYQSKKVRFISDGKIFLKVKRFKINVPKSFRFVRQAFIKNAFFYQFSNNKIEIIIEIHNNNFMIERLTFCECDKIPKSILATLSTSKIFVERQSNKFCGFFQTKNYLVYYLNTDIEDVDKLNEAIMSIQEK